MGNWCWSESTGWHEDGNPGVDSWLTTNTSITTATTTEVTSTRTTFTEVTETEVTLTKTTISTTIETTRTMSTTEGANSIVARHQNASGRANGSAAAIASENHEHH